MLAEGKGFCLAKNMEKTSPVRTVLERRHLGWGPGVALGDLRADSHFSGIQLELEFRQILTCRPLCTSQFIIIISSASSARTLTRTFFNFPKSRPEVIYCQILKCCCVLYEVHKSIVPYQAQDNIS